MWVISKVAHFYFICKSVFALWYYTANRNINKNAIYNLQWYTRIETLEIVQAYEGSTTGKNMQHLLSYNQ